MLSSALTVSLLDPNAQGIEQTSKFTSQKDDRKNCDESIRSLFGGSSTHSKKKCIIKILSEHFLQMERQLPEILNNLRIYLTL